MNTHSMVSSVLVAGLAFLVTPAQAASIIPFFFSTGNPDGKIGTLSRPSGPGLLETETADDFITTLPTTITSATFIGLLPIGALLTSIGGIEIEFYHVFPGDSTNPPSGNVPTRVNSPGDREFAAFDSAAGGLTFATTLLNSSFTVSNTVVNGIHPVPTQFTGGEGPATGQEVLFSIMFNTPLALSADHYFFRPEVRLTNGNFLWLSAPKPIVAPGTPFTPDLQSWIRNANLSPDWVRIGTDVTGPGPFNAAFSLTGTQVVPEPSPVLILGSGLALLAIRRRIAARKVV